MTMTLQEQIREAWARAPTMLQDGENIADHTAWTVGLLTGAGFPGAAMFVLAMGHEALGHDDPHMVALRAKLGLDQ